MAKLGCWKQAAELVMRLRLTYRVGLVQEVADEVGMSVSGVRKRLRGLRAELHDLVTEEENEITT